MTSLFDLLPDDIKRYEILPKLDEISLLILRHVLLDIPLPSNLSYSQQRNVIENGLSLTIFFWEKLNKRCICNCAVEYGNLDILKYARENALIKEGGSIRPPWDKYTCAYAALSGSLICLKYLYENDCPWDENTCAYAAKCGSIECLKYARENGCLWNRRTCEYAAESCSLECLMYAHYHGCPWNELTCAYASFSGSLECLKYARENGCPWDEKTYRYAVENDSIDLLKYVHDNECPQK